KIDVCAEARWGGYGNRRTDRLSLENTKVGRHGTHRECRRGDCTVQRDRLRRITGSRGVQVVIGQSQCAYIRTRHLRGGADGQKTDCLRRQYTRRSSRRRGDRAISRIATVEREV